VSQRRVCGLMILAESSFRYVSRRNDEPLPERVKEAAREKPDGPWPTVKGASSAVTSRSAPDDSICPGHAFLPRRVDEVNGIVAHVAVEIQALRVADVARQGVGRHEAGRSAADSSGRGHNPGP
jgi:hypothetical protein